MLPEAVLEMVTASGDLGKLSPAQRAQYITALCSSIGLNALSRPIELVTLNGKTVPYAKKDCTDQLRKLHEISITIVDRTCEDGVYTVTARATTPAGRTDEDVGAVTVGKLQGDALANAKMKAHTKAKRRVTLSICGLGMLDESELETVRNAVPLDTVPAPVITAKTEESQPAPDNDEVYAWIARMDSAEDLDQLEVYRAEVKAQMSDTGALLAVSKAYAARKKALS
jgi:hypothetical protein